MKDQNVIWKTEIGKGPLVAAAIHDGHKIREELMGIMALNEAIRLREEDPFTSLWTIVGSTKITGLNSRFEVDLNRPREKAVYINPEDSWGLKVWKEKPSNKIISNSLKRYDAFYKEVKSIFSDLEKQFGHFVVFDMHSYNHRRDGVKGDIADPKLNPEVNIGTGTVNRKIWEQLLNRFIEDLRSYNYQGRSLDVRENIKFKGGHFSKWIHETFPKSACSIAIEFKKFFMDEWTGKPDKNHLKEIEMALKSTVPGVLEELRKI